MPVHVTVPAPPLKPPLRSQGIKTALVGWIAGHVPAAADTWVEPFLGSGAVALNLVPPRALLADNNPHIIAFYRALQAGEVTGPVVRAYLEAEGARLSARGADHYFALRDRFNASHAPLDYLFLNRACFNGVTRFNRSGAFNVGFCKKPERFSKAFITKIVNQVDRARAVMAGKDWTFVHQDWRATVAAAGAGDFVYCDPPYVGRHTTYFGVFGADDDAALAQALQASPAGYAVSTWLSNRHRRNLRVAQTYPGHVVHAVQHQYHVGPRTTNRGHVTEGLILPQAA